MSDDFAEFIAHLSDNARTSLYHADSIARGYGSQFIGTEHLLMGLLAQSSSAGAKVLADAGVTLDKTEVALGLKPTTNKAHSGVNTLSETARMTLRMSWQVAQEFNHDSLGTEHILYSILGQKNSRATVLLKDMGINILEVIGELEEFFDRNSSFRVDSVSPDSVHFKTAKKSGILDAFGDDLTQRAREKTLDPVIGRSAQIDRVVTILSRRTKNNPVLIGEPGVGKTAIIEGLAQKIVEEDVPSHLLDRRVVQLDLASMIAGTKYRGEFEERLKKVVSELKSQKNVIIFIDELHLLVGAGAAEGALDAANLLKPALARGELHLIGATTFDEYRKNIEKDAALDRRLQSVTVPEPSLKDTRSILKGLKPYYEKHHGVSVDDEVIESAVYMSDRYIKDRFMPDKAIDVIDEASALVRVRNGKKPSKIRDFSHQLVSLNSKMEEAVNSEDYKRAAMYKTRISQLTTKISEEKRHMENKSPISLEDKDVSTAVSTITGIPVNHIEKSEAKLLSKLEKHLSKYVIGQDEAIEKVARAIRRSRSGVSSQNRPIGSFVFMGPTGVGKTELARVVAREVFGSSDSLIKIDMSEFGERHNTSRLLGSPAGYVGYDDGGQLTDKIRRQPYSVVLFDEIEKAHPDVFQLLLQLLEDGILTDAKGRKVDFSNTIVILTSNLGSDEMKKESSIGFQVHDSSGMKKLEALHKRNDKASRSALSDMMRPELINRFDAIVTFKALTRKQVGKIFDQLASELKDRLMENGIILRINPSVKKRIIDEGFDKFNGARPLRRAIEDSLEHALAEGVINGEYDKGSIVTASTNKGEIVLSTEYESK